MNYISIIRYLGVDYNGILNCIINELQILSSTKLKYHNDFDVF